MSSHKASSNSSFMRPTFCQVWAVKSLTPTSASIC